MWEIGLKASCQIDALYTLTTLQCEDDTTTRPFVMFIMLFAKGSIQKTSQVNFVSSGQKDKTVSPEEEKKSSETIE